MPISIDTIELNTSEEWLVRNALLAYKNAIRKCAQAERDEADAVVARSTNAVELIEAHQRLAQRWESTLARVEALEDKLA